MAASTGGNNMDLNAHNLHCDYPSADVPITGMLISHFLLQIKKDQHLTDNNCKSQRVVQRNREAARAEMKAPLLWVPVQCPFCYRTHCLSLVYFSALVNVGRMVNTGGFK